MGDQIVGITNEPQRVIGFNKNCLYAGQGAQKSLDRTWEDTRQHKPKTRTCVKPVLISFYGQM